MSYTINDLIEEYLAEHDTKIHVCDGRAVSLDLGNYFLSQLSGNDNHFY